MSPIERLLEKLEETAKAAGGGDWVVCTNPHGRHEMVLDTHRAMIAFPGDFDSEIRMRPVNAAHAALNDPQMALGLVELVRRAVRVNRSGVALEDMLCDVNEIATRLLGEETDGTD